jgi:hypothetical protein
MIWLLFGVQFGVQVMGALQHVKTMPSKLTLERHEIWDVEILRPLGEAFRGHTLRSLKLDGGSLHTSFWRTLPWLMRQLLDLTVLEMNDVSRRGAQP